VAKKSFKLFFNHDSSRTLFSVSEAMISQKNTLTLQQSNF